MKKEICHGWKLQARVQAQANSEDCAGQAAQEAATVQSEERSRQPVGVATPLYQVPRRVESRRGAIEAP